MSISRLHARRSSLDLAHAQSERTARREKTGGHGSKSGCGAFKCCFGGGDHLVVDTGPRPRYRDMPKRVQPKRVQSADGLAHSRSRGGQCHRPIASLDSHAADGAQHHALDVFFHGPGVRCRPARTIALPPRFTCTGRTHPYPAASPDCGSVTCRQVAVASSVGVVYSVDMGASCLIRQSMCHGAIRAIKHRAPHVHNLSAASAAA